MKKIFFSYSRADSDFALKLARDLRAAGQEVWLDQLDIPAGARWDRSVEKALAGCPNLIVILSPTSVASPNVMDEVSFAIDEGKRLIPIVREQCQIPFRLRRFQYIDFTGDYDQALATTLKDLARRDSMAMPIPDEPADSSAAASSTLAQPASPASQKPAQPAREPAPTPKQPAVSEDRPQPSPAPPRPQTPGDGRKATPWIIAGGLAAVIVGAIGFTQGWFTAGTENGNGATVPASGRPVARFTATPVAGQAPLDVSFSSQSAGDIDVLLWEFGDGGASREANPTHTFREATSYSVTLTATGPGGSHNATQTVTVLAATVAIAAEFTARPTSGEAPLSVEFQDQSRGPVNRFQWEFGDGTNSADRSPQHRYTAPGTYTVSLTVRGSDGQDVVRKSGLITVARASNTSPPEEFRCMQGAWNETTGEGPGAPFTWTMTLSGNVLTARRDDGTAEGQFTWTGRDFRGPLTWYNGDVWEGVVLAAPSRNCGYVETNQGWKYVRYRSVNSDTAVRITFRNATDEPVEVYWVDDRGTPVKYSDLQPGQSYVQDTFSTHPWQFRQRGGVIGYYTGTTSQNQSFDIGS